MSVAGHKTEISEMLDQFCLRAAKLTQTRTPIWSAYVKILWGCAARVLGVLWPRFFCWSYVNCDPPRTLSKTSFQMTFVNKTPTVAPEPKDVS